MKKFIIIFLFLLFPAFVSAVQPDSTIKIMRSGLYEQLGMDTTGTDAEPIYLANKHLQHGVERTGWDLGIEVSKMIATTANRSAILLDTALIRTIGVFADTLGGKPIRTLKPVSHDSLSNTQYDGAITTGRNATQYFVFGDSIYIAPISSDVDTITVLYYKKTTYMADTTTATNLPMEYRRVAIMWACYEASEHMNNGRSEEFLKRYNEQIMSLWGARYGKVGK